MSDGAREVEVIFGAELNSPARNSVLAELLLLKECCADSSSVDPQLLTILLDKLKSQGGLASLEWRELGIVSMSLNTHKSAAGNVIVGGFNTLNSYRKAALVSLNQHLVVSARPTRGTIDWYKTEFQTKSAENAVLIDEITLLSGKLNSVMEYARKLAAKAKKSEEFLALQSDLLRKFPSLPK